MVKVYHGRFITAEGTMNSSNFNFFSKEKAKKDMLEIARGNCQEGSSCEYFVEDDSSKTLFHGKVSKRNGKYSYINIGVD